MAQERLTPAQTARLKQYLPRTFPKLQARQPVTVVIAGDSISTFYQPAGRPRYDSAMAWHGRFLSKLGGLFYYHGGVVDEDPHKELENLQKETTAAWEAYAKTASKGTESPNPLRFTTTGPQPTDFKVPDIIRRGVPISQQPSELNVIIERNLARDGSLVPEVLEALTSIAAFPPEPHQTDLVMICYGVNDSNAGYSLTSYRAFLERAVAICQAQKADVILAAPPLILTGEPRDALGRTRPYAAVMQEVAEKAGVFFADLGAAMARRPSDLQAMTAEDAFAAALDPIRQQFDHGPDVEDLLHLNGPAALRAGEAEVDHLLNGPLTGQLEISGALEVTSEDEALLTLRVLNPTDQPVTAALCPLSITGYMVKPGTPDSVFNFKPQQARRLKLPCVRIPAANPWSRNDLPPAGEEFVRGSLLVSDDDLQQVRDFKVALQPLSLLWPEGRLDQASGDFLLTTTLVNTSLAPLKGTATIEWMGKVQTAPVDLQPGVRQPFPVRLSLPAPDAPVRFKQTVVVKVQLPDRTLRFERDVEGLRHIGVDERFPMVPLADWQAARDATRDPDAVAAWVTPYADANGIFFRVEVPAGVVTGQTTGPWGVIELQLDGRGPKANGTLGFVDRIAAEIPWSDGPLKLRTIRPACFGDGYQSGEYDPKGFLTSVTTAADGSRRIDLAVHRNNFTLHEWSLNGTGQNTLGFNLRLSFADPSTNGFSAATACAISLSGFPFSDARSLTVLELTPNPAPRWSLRVY